MTENSARQPTFGSMDSHGERFGRALGLSWRDARNIGVRFLRGGWEQPSYTLGRMASQAAVVAGDYFQAR